MKVSLETMVLVTTVLFGACTVEQELVLKSEYSGLWILEGRPMSFSGDILEDLAILGSYDSLDTFYDSAISETIANLEARGDIEDFEVVRVGKYAWMANVEFNDIRSLLGDAALGGIVDISQEGDLHILKLSFDRARAAEFENLFPILKEPTFSLFNPAASEGFSEEEYITKILGFALGEKNLPELRRSMVALSLTVPGTVVEVEGGAELSENSVRFEAPLTRLLVPEKELVWVLRWKRRLGE